MIRALCCTAALLLLGGTATADEPPAQALTIRIPAPRAELGVTAGKVYQQDRDGDAIGLRAALRSGTLSAGLEVGKREVAGYSIDRTAGAIMSVDLGAGRLVPRVLLGGGVGRLLQPWDTRIDYAFAHIGGGGGLRLTPRVTLGAELRVGTRQVLRRDEGDYRILAADPALVPPLQTDVIGAAMPRDYVELQLGLAILL